MNSRRCSIRSLLIRLSLGCPTNPMKPHLQRVDGKPSRKASSPKNLIDQPLRIQNNSNLLQSTDGPSISIQQIDSVPRETELKLNKWKDSRKRSLDVQESLRIVSLLERQYQITSPNGWYSITRYVKQDFNRRSVIPTIIL